MFLRYDASTIVLLEDGQTYLLAVSAFTGGGDLDPSSILFYNSIDLVNWNFVYELETPATTVGLLCPSLHVKSNGDVFLMVLNNTSTTTNRLLSYISTDNGATWGSQTTVRENVGEYMSPMSHRIFVTRTGRLLYSFSVNTNGQLGSQTGNYTGYTMYTDNEGTNWITSGSTLISPDNLCVESGVFKKNELTLVTYFRNRSGVVYASNSVDNGVTWGVVYDLGIKAINSTTTILRLSNNTFIASFNDTTRSVMELIKSSDGATWSDIFILNAGAPYHYIEPTIVEKNGFVHVFYSKSDSDQSTWSLRVKKVSINY